MQLKDKIALITGAASGIGLATARLFAREGAIVVLADRNGDALGVAATELAAFSCRVDVSQSKDVESMISKVDARFGRIDVLVNNAGYGFLGTVETIEEGDWDALMAANLKSVFLCSKHVIPLMARSGGGSIINTASYTASIGIPNRAAYVASKGAIVALTRAMALDHVGQRIRVNCVAPGTIESPYFEAMRNRSSDPARFQRVLEMRSPMQRIGKPEEIASMMLWLASDDASFATGGIFTVDGGTSIWSGPELPLS